MLRIGIVGTNFISDRLLDAVKKTDGVIVTAVYSRTEERGREFAARHGISAVYTDLRAFAASHEIDAAYIASPNLFHGEQSLLLLQNKKHVLCEKPLAKDLNECIRAKAAAEENGCVYLEAMRPVFTPTFEKLREYLGEIGKIRSVQLGFSQYSSRYDRFLRGEVLNAFNPALANAALMDIGVYPIEVLISLFGLPLSFESHSHFLSNGFEGAGHILAVYDGFHASIAYSKIHNSSLPSVIEGEAGSVMINKMNSFDTVTLKTSAREERFTDTEENNMVYELTAFREMTEKKRDAAPYLEASLSTVRFLDAVREKNGIVF